MVSFNDPADDFEKRMVSGGKKGGGPVYDWPDRLPGDVAGLTRAVARSAAEAAGYVGRVAKRVLNPFAVPSDDAVRRMVNRVKAEREYWYFRGGDDYVPPAARGRKSYPQPKRMPRGRE